MVQKILFTEHTNFYINETMRDQNNKNKIQRSEVPSEDDENMSRQLSVGNQRVASLQWRHT